MVKNESQACVLADRLCRPQRIGIFGQHGVGKTTFLTVLYREGVGGRLAGLRIASADARTAEYLADKILLLEAGQALPATLAETDLRFHLYEGSTQLDLLFRDYQGEHVALGRAEPIRDFLRECDAIWLCLDVSVTENSSTCLRAQQEVEQLVEDYLAAQPPGTPHRPMALILTKADLLRPHPTAITTVIQHHLGMTRHALESHCLHHAIMAVSCLSQAADPNGEGHLLPTLQPTGLVEPLHWLTQTLQKQDQDRLEQLWNLVPQDLVLLQRCVSTFTRRYPNAEASGQFRLRLARQRRRQRLRRVAVGLGLFLALVLSLWGYDAWANHQVEQFARTHSTDPEAVLEQWTSFERWHPTRHLWLARSLAAEADFRHDMEQQCRAARCERQLAELRRDMRDADANLTQVWERLQRVRDDFPEHKIDDELVAYSATVKSRLLEQRERLAEEAYQRLLQRESQDDNQTRVRSAEQFLTEHANTSHVPAIRHRLEGYLRAEEERAMLAVRRYSAENPFHFYSRQEQYRAYLQRFPTGQYASEARSAVAAIETDWDRYDFRKIRDHLQEKPGELKVLDQLSRAYLAAHAQGKYVSVTHDLLRWSERVASEGSYKVTLRSGSFDPKTNGYLSRGLNLSVELEVNGVHYGPSTIARRTAEPEWDYTFPRPIRWKLGDTVKIRVTDHYYWKRTILEVNSEDDPLGMRLLSGEVVRGKHAMKFESDFDMPVLPRLE